MAKPSFQGYAFSILGILAVTLALAPLHARLSSMTVALALLLVVLFTATKWGSRPAIAASILGGLCLNFFFLPPVYTFTISDWQNWVALIVFLITALTAGELSARVRQRAEQAETDRREIERLYQNYRAASEKARQAEIFEQGERLKSALLDAVTHDLRTPLTSIKAAATTLLAEARADEPVALDEESRLEFLEVIDEETDRLNRFVENMIELARLEAGAAQPRRRWTSIEEIVGLARERAAPLIAGHRFELQLAEDLPAVRVDATLIAEVFYALIDNAAKYSPPGGRILVSGEVADAGAVRLCVEDEGRGVPPDLREAVFEKFFRAAGEAGHPKGTGMGLAIARGIIEAHGGTIHLETGAGSRGTRAVFVLPIGDEEPAAPEQTV